MELRDRVAIITGAGSGIGRAIAVEFAREGAKVVCCGRRENRLIETVRLIEKEKGTGLAVTMDVTKTDDVDRLILQTVDRFGGLDVLFNNAGSFNCLGAVWEADPEEWWRDVTINLRGPMLTMSAALRVMMKQDRGVILNMNGGGATSPLTGGSAYGSSKAALLRVTDTLARELEHENSRVLVVALGPGFVRTEMTELQAVSPMGLKWIPSSKEGLDKGQTLPPEDCARASVELLRHITPKFNGRIFQTGMDFAEMAKRLEKPESANAFLMRLIS